MDIVLAMERSLTTARSEAFLRERHRELEASELALAQALSLDERHGVPPHLDADVCLATYLSVQTLERERRSMRMRPALREQAGAPFAAVPSAQGRGAPHLGLELRLQPRSVRPQSGRGVKPS